MTNYEQTYETFWKEICEKDGVPDMDAIKRELSDYHQLMDNAGKVYCHVTANRISKVNTVPDAVMSVADEMEMERTEEAVKEATDELKAENKKLLGFSGKILGEHREHDCADVGGYTIQDAAEKFGLLESVEMKEPCGPNCICAEMTTFPTHCLIASELGLRAMNFNQTPPQPTK